ncbi:hypothetical protein EJ08DRAFT_732527 [Tothia fuscella]|uniref:DNA (cytosine-5)-methyltransferase 1 replication foci domain-containing protein n=1 Tax=Tothia fuscella TaxID=1048955 RepID=A0A9P4NUF5_9PEZI|nr:hypothetical protein EJ08DRAFT_732527 [Tothia fuscella]
MASKPIPESKALPARDLKLRDENEWPEYHLRDVEVTDGKGREASLLHADPAYPLVVTGTLELDRARLGLLLPSAAAKSKNPIIQIKAVTHFSYGAYANGDVDIWAAGEAGWYRIKPSPSYVATFQTMIEAVNILYFTADSYKSSDKLRADELFAKYADIHHITPVEAKEKFYGHAKFLASRMMKGEEGVRWGHTGFYQHLRKMRPEAFRAGSPVGVAAVAVAPVRVAAPVRPVAARIQRERPVVASRPQLEDERPTRSRRELGRPPGRSRKEEATTSKTREKERPKPPPLVSKVNRANAITVWKFLQKVVNEHRPDPGVITIETFAHYLMQAFTFEDEEEAAIYLQYIAADLVSMMQLKRRRNYEWPELQVYDELLEAKLTPAQKRKMAAVILEKRKQPLVDEDDEDISNVDSDSSEEEVMDEEEMAAHHTKSGLRPKSGSKFSGKGASGKGKGKGKAPTLSVTGDDGDEDGDPMDIDTPSKRKSFSGEEESTKGTPPKKRFTRSQGDQDPELEDLEFAWQQAKSTGIPIRRKEQEHPNGEKVKIRHTIVAEPVFSAEPTGPRDVWTCPHSGCLHKVYGACEEEGVELIWEHRDEHRRNDKIDLILSEEGRTHLPVSNLIKRIREMAEAQNGPSLGVVMDPELGAPVTTLFPQRITRRV